MTHSEITALLWLAVAASSGLGGLLAGHWWWPSKKRLNDNYYAGREIGYDRGYDDGRYDEAQRHAPPPEGGHTVIDAEPGRTIYPELAALAAGQEPEPLPELDPHWYAKWMHYVADWHVEAQQESAWFDELWLPGYLDHMRQSLEPRWTTASRMLEAL